MLTGALAASSVSVVSVSAEPKKATIGVCFYQDTGKAPNATKAFLESLADTLNVEFKYCTFTQTDEAANLTKVQELIASGVDGIIGTMDLGTQSPVEVREAQSVNGPLAVLNEYYDVYVTQPEDAKWRLDNMHETYLQDMNSKYVYPNVFMSIDDTNKVSQYDTDIKKYAEQKKADWILNGGIEKEWDSYLKKMEQYGLSDYLSIKQKYFDEYQKSLSEEK